MKPVQNGEQNDREADSQCHHLSVWIQPELKVVFPLSFPSLDWKQRGLILFPRSFPASPVQKRALPSSFPEAITKLSESPTLAPRKLEKILLNTESVGGHSEWTEKNETARILEFGDFLSAVKPSYMHGEESFSLILIIQVIHKYIIIQIF